MRLLIIECGSSSLPAELTTVVSKQRPKAEMISTMNLSMEKINIPEFKRMLIHLMPDHIVLLPPERITENPTFVQVLREVTRQVEMMTGRVLFVSSVDVLGDAPLRTESANEVPYSDIGCFLGAAEATIEQGTSRHYIMRFPYTVESAEFKQWLSWANPNTIPFMPAPADNKTVTFARVSDIAETIAHQIQTGWFGKFHATPNDSVLLSSLISNDHWDTHTRVADRSLASKHTWRSMSPSQAIWIEEFEAEYK